MKDTDQVPTTPLCRSHPPVMAAWKVGFVLGSAGMGRCWVLGSRDPQLEWMGFTTYFAALKIGQCLPDFLLATCGY